MDIKKAAVAMRPFLQRCKPMGSNERDETSIEHLTEMLDAIESGKVNGEKAHRWLGWVQGVVCCRGGATLEEMKAVNFAA